MKKTVVYDIVINNILGYNFDELKESRVYFVTAGGIFNSLLPDKDSFFDDFLLLYEVSYVMQASTAYGKNVIRKFDFFALDYNEIIAVTFNSIFKVTF